MQNISIKKEEWDKTIEQMLLSFTVFAATENEYSLDFEKIYPSSIGMISYNTAKPATSLKTFFLPVREDVTSELTSGRQRIIIGAPNCDICGLRLLDEIYLDKDFNDIFYRSRRENTILITVDCFKTQEHCHCTSYNVTPYSDSGADLAVILIEDNIIVRVISEKGKDLISCFLPGKPPADDLTLARIDKAHKKTESLLRESNKGLPDYEVTGKLVRDAGKEIWEKYSASCVSCGACTTICPTCSCFLLIDKPGFEKVRQTDACQYPGFERVAGGEDALFSLPDRFRNRYMCKYVWKPEKFKSSACTGCGRCIEACIGKINKNELFAELENMNHA
jgi:ferredoxin